MSEPVSREAPLLVAPLSFRLPAYTRHPIAALGGVLIALGGAPHLAYGLAWCGLPLVHLAYLDAARVDGATDEAPRSVRIRQGALTGLSAGFAANLVTMEWAVELFEEHAFLPLPLAIVLGALLWFAQSLPFVLAGVFTTVLVARLAGRVSVGHLVPVAFVAAGALGPMFFPWRVGTSQTELAWLSSWAELGGVSLVDLFLVLPTVLLVEAARTHEKRALAGGLSCLALGLGGGALLHDAQADRHEAAPRVRVGIVHTSLSIAERHDPMRFEAHHLALLARTAELEAAGAELVLWPETAYSFQWPRDRVRDAVGLESVLARGVHGPVVFGALTYTRLERWNSVVALGSDGARIGIVDKRVLMPFSERMPLYDWLTPWHDVLPISLTPAAAPGSLEVGPVRLGILNCYEDLSDEHTAWLAARDPDILTNHTNDAWFGSHGAELHLFLARLRAIETGRDLLRVVNGGVSAHVASTGEVVARRGADDSRPFLAEPRVLRGRTPFVRFGDLTGWAAIGALLAALLTRPSRERPVVTAGG